VTSLVRKAVRAFHRRRHIRQRLEQIKQESSLSRSRTLTVRI
jgi:hypothetical protein